MTRLLLAIGGLAFGAFVAYQRRETIRHRVLVWMIGSRPVIANVTIPAPAPRVQVKGDHPRGVLLLGIRIIDMDGAAIEATR